EEVIYGRKVGWSIREVKLPQKVEDVSGTSIRQQTIKDDNL
ncbi:unnamed protein product, partial [marine sediment metagenome]